LGVPLPVDPGDHTIVATAPGHKKWQTTVAVGANADKKSVAVPELEAGSDEPAPDGAAGPSDGGGPAGASSEQIVPPPDDESDFWNGQRWAGLGVGVVGVAGIVVGAVFGSKASSAWDEALTYCQGEDTANCGPEAGPLSEDAYTFGTVSTVAFVVGGAALAGGLVIFLTAPSGDDGTSTEQEGDAPLPEAETALRLRVRGAPAAGRASIALEGRF
jgi:hypothetical protein